MNTPMKVGGCACGTGTAAGLVGVAQSRVLARQGLPAGCGCGGSRPAVAGSCSCAPGDLNCDCGSKRLEASPEAKAALHEFLNELTAAGEQGPVIAGKRHEHVTGSRPVGEPPPEVALSYGSSRRCTDADGTLRPRASFIDLCRLPWVGPPPGTFEETLEPPQEGLPPWGPLPLGEPRPRPQEMTVDQTAYDAQPVEPAVAPGNTIACVPSAGRGIAATDDLICPHPVIQQVALEEKWPHPVQPEERGKPSPPGLRNCPCDCVPTAADDDTPSDGATVIQENKEDVFPPQWQGEQILVGYRPPIDLEINQVAGGQIPPPHPASLDPRRPPRHSSSNEASTTTKALTRYAPSFASVPTGPTEPIAEIEAGGAPDVRRTGTLRLGRQRGGL